jgi:hypothetical protein
MNASLVNCFLLICCLVTGAATVVSEESGLKEEYCCISVYVQSSGRAEELTSLTGCLTRVGSAVLAYSEGLSEELDRRGFETTVTCLRPVEEKALNQFVWDIFLGQKTETNSGRPLYAKTDRRIPPQMAEEEFLFLEGGTVVPLNGPHRTIASVSGHGEYVGFFTREDDNLGKWTIFDRFGQGSAALQIPVRPDDLVDQMVVSDAGNFVLVEESSRSVSFYSKQGEFIKRVSFRDRYPEDIHAVLSDNGRYCLIQLSNFQDESSVEARLYTSDGTDVSRFVHGEYHRLGGPLALSPDGSYAVTSSVDWPSGTTPCGTTYLLNRMGSVIRRLDDHYVSKVTFDSQGAYVGLQNPNHVMIIRTQDGSTVFERKTQSLSKGFDFAEDGKVVAILEGTWLIILDFGGRELWRRKFPAVASTPHPKLVLSADGSELSMTLENRFFAFELIREEE